MATGQSWTSRGVKRQAEDELEGEQRLSKRFNLLNLGRNSNLCIDPHDALHPLPGESAAQVQAQAQALPNSGRPSNDYMEVEDTKDRVFIHDLDEELAELENEQDQEERIIFIPDVERRLNGLPKHLLRGGDPPDLSYQSPTGNELVLYSVPSSLTSPPEKDVVRRAILESRARSQQEQKAQLQRDRAGENQASGTNNGKPAQGNNVTDAMDIG